MEVPEVIGAELEEIIPKAVAGDDAALKTLLNHPWLYLRLNEIADWAWHKFKVDEDRLKVRAEDDDEADDIYGRGVERAVARAVRRRITTLRNGRKIWWRDCLESWCYRVASNHCRNVINRDWPLKANYRENVRHDNSDGRRGGKKVMSPRSKVISEREAREQESEIEREEALKRSRVARVKETIRRVFDSLTPEHRVIVRLWAEKNMTCPAIAVETGIPPKAAWRELKASQKEFVKEIHQTAEELAEESDRKVSVEQILEDLMKCRAGRLRELIASGLREVA